MLYSCAAALVAVFCFVNAD